MTILRPARQTTDVDDQIQRRGKLAVDGADRQVGRHQDQHFQSLDHLAGAVGVNGGHRAVVAGIHGLDHVEGLGPAAFAHHDPIGPHAQGIFDQVAHRVFARPFDVGRLGFQRDDVLLVQPQLGGVFDGNDPLFEGDETARGCSASVVLPVPVPPLTRMFRRSITHARRNVAAAAPRQFISTRSSIVSRWAGNLRTVSVGPLQASGGIMALTREPSGSRASTSGWLLSIRRPTWATIRSMIDSVTLSEMNRRPDFSIMPSRST